MTQVSASSTRADRARLLAKPLGAVLLILGAIGGATPASNEEYPLSWIIKPVSNGEKEDRTQSASTDSGAVGVPPAVCSAAAGNPNQATEART